MRGGSMMMLKFVKNAMCVLLVRAPENLRHLTTRTVRLFLSGCADEAGDRGAEEQVHEAPPDPDCQLRAGRGRGQADRRDLPRHG